MSYKRLNFSDVKSIYLEAKNKQKEKPLYIIITNI